MVRTKFGTKKCNKMTRTTEVKRTYEPTYFRNILINAVVAYNKHSKEWAEEQDESTLLAYCHPEDRQLLGKELGFEVDLSRFNYKN